MALFIENGRPTAAYVPEFDIRSLLGAPKSVRLAFSAPTRTGEAMSQQIIQAIQKVLPDAMVHLDSADGVHHQALVISPSFEGMPLVRQHQMVLNALKAEFDSDRVHALQLRTFTPEVWARRRDEYDLKGEESTP